MPFRLRPAFPPVNSGGLIEAMAVTDIAGYSFGGFPPVNSGGLIEAWPRTSLQLRSVHVSAGEFRRPH